MEFSQVRVFSILNGIQQNQNPIEKLLAVYKKYTSWSLWFISPLVVCVQGVTISPR